ncbi:MAG: SsrA-binding protein SmpB [Planctomycetota bacterium]|nr:SsrA-binding protein SmpB [Planctomycetota bacterium]
MAKQTSGKSQGSKVPSDDEVRVVARNRRARFEFELLEKIEAGLVLTGTEVKSLRNGKSSLEESYATVENDEVWLQGCDIPEYLQANRMNHKPKRPRKLLLHRREIDKIATRTSEKGLTLVPTRIYFKNGVAKVEICIAKGRKMHDKRNALKTKDAQRDIDRALRGR